MLLQYSSILKQNNAKGNVSMLNYVFQGESMITIIIYYLIKIIRHAVAVMPPL